MLSANISGGLTKLGSGTLTLSGTNTYTGVTSVSNGVLRLAHALALSSATALTLAADTSVDLAFTGTNVIYSLTVDGDLKQAGVYGASRLYGRLTGTGYLMTTYGPAKGTMIRFF